LQRRNGYLMTQLAIIVLTWVSTHH